ncbi:MAG: beta-galactosidase, partial [Chloroflexota bacterium]
MIRQFLILVITLVVLAGSLVTTGATLRNRDDDLRGYVDPTQDAHLPYRIPHLGVNAELTQYSPDQLTRQLDLMRQAHITWVRQSFRWSEIEPQPGVFQWDRFDAIVQPFADDPDLKLVAVLLDAPAWASETDHPSASPADPARFAPPANTFAAFATDFAARYGETIDFYQIWDEPNLSSGWGGEPRPAAYLALLQAAYR